ncbi:MULTISPECIES: SDR family NAD(P)-dependent oxidoreductase [Sanguibacteroides]|uniref:Oxidoreductase n=1 Tax=Sanguibacteroides justesenii TaxID=1547597 RepID=A0A0C3MGN3_9PORP|nr:MULTISPECIES: SDR family NAD(P)-dependent oxidoreductase [Sanguibacteroides]KIO43494.1 oxidoreductase [Sanguibacteroides justesenii]KIO45663.1 oxidoreductase [Sanguibacteroides justesenii]PXZ45244.1 SDR family NAD(P)-dependent oxidoreductase [Sanguibacteroides justesenii]
MDRNKLKGKFALVTGASSGIGKEYARELGAMGYGLVLVSNEEERIREVGAELAAEYGVETHPLYMDLAVTNAAEHLYTYCKDRNLEIEVLVNNAGIFKMSKVVNLPVAVTEKMLLLHMVTPAMLCRYFGEDMKGRGRGYILNMSSMSAWLSYPGISLYASTKCFLKCFSRAFRLEMLDYGIYVTVLCPGAIATDLYHLSKRLQKLALRLGVMMTPQKLARRAIRGMFRKRAWMMPGLVNYFFMFFLFFLPLGMVRWIMRKTKMI